MSNERRAPARWPTDDMVVSGAEVLHDSLRMFGIDINLDTETTGTEIQQEIVEAVFNAMLTAAPKAEQPPVHEPVAEVLVSSGMVVDVVRTQTNLEDGFHRLYAAPQPVSDGEITKLLSCVRYLTGIAERGMKRSIREDESVESFVLGYVQSLETQPSDDVAKDAARYQWLVKHATYGIDYRQRPELTLSIYAPDHRDGLSAAIDAAMGQGGSDE